MRRGFTLLEVLVALALTGIVVLLAHRLFSVAVDSSGALLRNRREQDNRANSERWTEEAFLSLAVGQAGDPRFEGQEATLDAAAWTVVAQGWRERVPLQLGMRDDRLELRLGETVVTLGTRLASARFEYLTGIGPDRRWAGGWSSDLGAPEAIRIIMEHGDTTAADTCVYLIGERG